MFRLTPAFLVALVAVALLPAAAQAADGASAEIVVMRSGGLTHAELAHAGVDATEDLPIPGVEVVTAENDRAQALAALRADPDVAWAEPNRPRHVSSERMGGLLWGLDNSGQTV